MYQAEEKIEYLEMAYDVSHWAELLFGYFVKSNRTDKEKAQQIEAFAEELEQLQPDCLKHIKKAKVKWIEESNQRPPSIPQFLQMLREFNNIEQRNSIENKIEFKKDSVYSISAHSWDGLSSDQSRREYIKNFNQDSHSQATKFVIRMWMRENNYKNKQIREILGYGW